MNKTVVARESTLFAVAIAASAGHHYLLRRNLVAGGKLTQDQIDATAEANCKPLPPGVADFATCIKDETAHLKGRSFQGTGKFAMVLYNSASLATVTLPLTVAYGAFDAAMYDFGKEWKTLLATAGTYAVLVTILFYSLSAAGTAPTLAQSAGRTVLFATAAAALSALMHEMYPSTMEKRN